MMYLLVAAGYVAVVLGGIRFFQTVRKWDDAVEILMSREIQGRKSMTKSRPTHRRVSSLVSRRPSQPQNLSHASALTRH